MTRHCTPWGEKEDDRLRTMIENGMVYSEIAKRLGKHRTKSQVCGRVRRLGLSNPENNPVRPGAMPNAKRRRPAQAKQESAERLKAAPKAPAIKVSRGHPEENRHTPAPHPSRRAPRPSDAIWHPRTCQYPIGDPREPDFHFCDAPITPDGRAYCDEHYARCYTKRPEKAPGEGGIQSFKMNGWKL